MTSPSLSISSSEPVTSPALGGGGGGFRDPAVLAAPRSQVRRVVAPAPGGFRDAVVVAAWMLATLVAIDVAIDRAFRIPGGFQSRPPGALAAYFNYGASIEAKIRRGIGPSQATTSLLTRSGWVDEQAASNPGVVAPPGGILASFYGMSFSSDLALRLAEVEPRVGVRLFGGPAAPANHSHAIYRLDRGKKSEVVVLGVLASSVKGLVTNNGMTWRFEGPAPFTYPRFVVKPAGIEAQWPAVRTLDDMRAVLADPVQWRNYLDQLRATDDFFNDFLIRHDFADSSTIVRLIRRAAAQRWEVARAASIHGHNGFVATSPAIVSLRAIVADFAAIARSDGKIPIVLLLEDQGYGDHLDQILESTLRAGRIPHLSTHAVCSPTDRRNFVSDGHFTEAANRKLAAALLEIIRGELPGRLPPAAPAGSG